MQVSTNKGSYTVYLPESLFRKVKALPEHTSINKSFLAVLLFFIINGMIKDNHDGSGWIRLASDILRRYQWTQHGKIHSYAEHLLYLEAHGLIEINHSYSTDKRQSKSYRILPYLLNTRSGIERFHLDKPLANLVVKHNGKRKKLAKHSNPELTKWLDDPNFQMDKEAALVYTESKYISTEDDEKRIARHKAISDYGNVTYSRDTSDGRLHNNYSNMASNLRQFISYRKERMVSYDIKSSQPFMFSYLLRLIIKEYINSLTKDEGKRIETFRKNMLRHLTKFCVLKPKPNIVRGIKKINKDYLDIDISKIVRMIVCVMYPNKGQSANIEEINEFIKLIHGGDLYMHIGLNLLDSGAITEVNGKFYITLYKKSKKKQVTEGFDSLRECGKKITFNGLYASVCTTNKASIEFKKLFPEVFKIADAIKGGRPVDRATDTGELKTHNRLSILLQRMEAKFILDYCTKRIAKKYPNMPLITIHDSIATTTSYAAVLKVEFEKCMQDYFGIAVELLPEPW